MQPRYLNVQVIIARSFARIHETNLKKQGILALTFANPDDWNKVQEKDRISVVGMKDFKPGKPLTVILSHADGSQDRVQVNHTYTDCQIEWFRYGSSLNMLRAQNQAKAKNA